MALAHHPQQKPNLVPAPAADGSAQPELRGRRTRSVARLLQPLPDWAWISGALLAMVCLSTRYPILSLCSIAVLLLAASLLYFRGESPILFACCGMHWVQAVGATIYCNLFNVPIEEAFGAPGMEEAAWLSLGAVLALAVGMRTAMNPVRRGEVVATFVEQEISQIDFGRLVKLWVFAYIVSSVANRVGWWVTSLHQFLVPLGSLKWVAFYMLAVTVFGRDRGQFTLYAIVIVEFLGGLVGFFSTFKEVLFLFMIAAISGRRALNARMKTAFATAAVAALVASIFWSSIKVDYRQFMTKSGEIGASRSSASTADKLGFLKDRLEKYDGEMLEEGVKRLITRVAYTNLFGLTISHTPHFEPFAGGELWLGAVKHVLMPRIIFQNKDITDDSARARRFTGTRMSGVEDSTSIGIGYIAESYADFGRVLMFVPIYLVGLFMGLIYDRSLLNKHSVLLGSALGTAIVFSMLQGFAMANMKVIGGLLVHVLAFWALNKVYGRQIVVYLRGR